MYVKNRKIARQKHKQISNREIDRQKEREIEKEIKISIEIQKDKEMSNKKNR